MSKAKLNKQSSELQKDADESYIIPKEKDGDADAGDGDDDDNEDEDEEAGGELTKAKKSKKEFCLPWTESSLTSFVDLCKQFKCHLKELQSQKWKQEDNAPAAKAMIDKYEQVKEEMKAIKIFGADFDYDRHLRVLSIQRKYQRLVADVEKRLVANEDRANFTERDLRIVEAIEERVKQQEEKFVIMHKGKYRSPHITGLNKGTLGISASVANHVNRTTSSASSSSSSAAGATSSVDASKTPIDWKAKYFESIQKDSAIMQKKVDAEVAVLMEKQRLDTLEREKRLEMELAERQARIESEKARTESDKKTLLLLEGLTSLLNGKKK